MTVIGLGFNKLVVEKSAPLKGKVSIKNDAAVKNVEKIDLTMAGAKQDALKFSFEFKSLYEPNFAHITLTGDLVWVDKPETNEKILKEWKKDKAVPKEVMNPVLNAILSKSNVEALILSREMNLPSPIPLPKVELK